MQLVQDESFNDLFRSCQREAFHLEVQDTYETPEESEPLRKFLNGEHDDYEWFQPWLDHVRYVTGRGVAIRRARVVSEPHTEYTRFAKAVARFNANAGEDVRYLPRHMISVDELTTDDWWLFDDALVAFTVFEPSGRWAGGAVSTDPRMVEYCRAVKERVWARAVPLREYTTQ
ncbi:hypothetical protein B0T44_17225 [Nocardia donostiensis]|uniref:DUF6879 domain-containing protein n=1 Tax=Nocardia donostiensis TaxID=1538463 RepID=A0A1W0B436_9NOCA|nr:hypothetical protein B0T46_00775 [Nocardia donostiensis]OQS17275.1 hypothetical protein B0T36_01375 [Nocardia donostiensis]OQS18856.1 hypothetical protein B0T44_17225 [Nocardia donostiensis]